MTMFQKRCCGSHKRVSNDKTPSMRLLLKIFVFLSVQNLFQVSEATIDVSSTETNYHLNDSVDNWQERTFFIQQNAVNRTADVRGITGFAHATAERVLMSPVNQDRNAKRQPAKYLRNTNGSAQNSNHISEDFPNYQQNASFEVKLSNVGRVKRSLSGFRWTGHTCGKNLVGSGTIMSPNFPGNYPNNVKCLWTIQVSSTSTKIVLRIRHFSTETLYDIVKISSTSEPEISLSGTKPSQEFSLGSFVTVEFTADDSFTSTGFEIEFISADSSSGTCEDGWVQQGPSCYRLTTPLMWSEAQSACRAMNGSLTDIVDANEQNYVYEVVRQQRPGLWSAWIGLSNMHTANWVWESGRPSTYSNWNNGEPNNNGGNEHCVELYSAIRSGWNDQNCSWVMPGVCKRFCETGWSSGGYSCYKVISHSSRIEAKQRCRSMNGFLADINNANEQADVYKVLRMSHQDDYTAWIGLTNIHRNGTWTWESQRPAVYINWDKGEPNNAGGSEYCTEVSSIIGRGWNDHSCDESRRALCRRNEFEINLVGGNTINEGRVEITYNGMRGTVCDDNFDDNDAQVICRSLGYNGQALAFSGARYGPGKGPIWIDNIQCLGSELHVAACKRSTWGVSDCSHSEDASVRCSTGTSSSPCGQRFFSASPVLSRIIGGRQALYGEYPWQVRIKIYGSPYHCGGTILNNRWILSAAHCFNDRKTRSYSIVVGDLDVTKQESKEEEFDVEEIAVHELYGYDNDYDFALLKLRRKSSGHVIQFSQYVQPACLPSSESTIYETGLLCHISGWGQTRTGVAAPILQAAEVPIKDDESCSKMYKNVKITSRMICAGFNEGGIDTCYGDSGGPMVCGVNGTFTVVGVTSFGKGCAMPNAVGVYAKVSSVLKWIKQHINA